MRTVSATVSFIVSSVDGLATISIPPDQTTTYGGTSSRHSYNFIVTASGNGPANFTVVSYLDSSSNSSGAGVTISPASISLGSSLTIAGSSATIINLPADGISNNSINGIGVGSLVQIASETRSVTAITDPPSGIASITLDHPLPVPPAPGIPVFEQKVVTLDITAGSINNQSTAVVVKGGVRVTGAAGTSSGQVTSTFTSTTATLVKYVRNLSNARTGNALGSGVRSFTINGSSVTFYTAGVTGKVGDLLEYLLVAGNSGTTPTSNSSIRDTLPVQFVAPKPDAYGTGSDLLYQDENGVESRLTLRSDSDTATLAGAVLTVNLGSGASSSSGGSIAAGKDVKILYQVTINQ